MRRPRFSLSGWISDYYYRYKNTIYVPMVLLAPSILMLAVLFVYPIAVLMIQAFQHAPTDPGKGFTLNNFIKLFGDFYYFNILLRSLLVGLGTTILTLFLGYPLALFLARSKIKKRDLLVVLLVAPLYTSIVVRVYAWMVILGKGGLINNLLTQWGVIQQPLPLMLNMTGVLIGLLHVYYAFMVLSIYSVVLNIDPALEEAAMNLGATRMRTLREVTIPLSMPGILAGSVLVFVLSMGAYVVPAFLGGRKVMMISNLIYTVVIDAFNWPFGAAIATALLIIALLLTYFYSKLLESPVKGGGFGG
ncbi:MAG TPA: ABC transporter permease [Firmicutes bacterium]|nr:ABC transporter permease [Bacillota bacterium]